MENTKYLIGTSSSSELLSSDSSSATMGGICRFLRALLFFSSSWRLATFGAGSSSSSSSSSLTMIISSPRLSKSFVIGNWAPSERTKRSGLIPTTGSPLVEWLEEPVFTFSSSTKRRRSAPTPELVEWVGLGKTCSPTFFFLKAVA